MRPRFFFYLCLFVYSSVLSTFSFPDEAHSLLEQADRLVNFPNNDFSAEYTIVEDRPGAGRNTTVVALFRRDAAETYTIIVLEPSATKGQGYLKQGKTLWFYDPESRRFNSTSAEERFQNTNARNSDFTSSTLAQDYRVTESSPTTLGRFECTLLELEARHDEVTYPKMRLWISDDGLVRKSEDYSLSGQLLRTTAIPDYYSIEGRYIPKRILLIDALQGAEVDGKFVNQRTQITINKPSLKDLPDSVFSKAFLENIGR